MKSIIAMILEAAEIVRVNLPALHALISQTKKIVYDKVNKSIHFIFFTRETARKHQGVGITFRGGFYSLANSHRPQHGTVWNGSSYRIDIIYGGRQSISSVSAV